LAGFALLLARSLGRSFLLSVSHDTRVSKYISSRNTAGFLYNLFADPDIIRLPYFLTPLQRIIAYVIAKRRAPKSRAAYEAIGGGSPILQYSQQQANLLCANVADRYGVNIRSYIGMRYWHPFTEEALRHIKRDRIDALVIVPLYPQFSISTSGSSLRVLQEIFANAQQNQDGEESLVRDGMVHTVVPSWYDRPGYINCMVELIQTELASFNADEIDEAKRAAPDQKPRHVLFSAHGVPVTYIAAGDPYQRHIEECVRLISAQIVDDDTAVHLSYQSRVGPIEWLRPYTDDVLPQLGLAQVKNLVVVPISFVSEHVETLEEIDMEYRELADHAGITNWRRCPALNTDANFINDMADLVMEALSEPRQSVTEACVANNVGGDDLVESADTILNGVGVVESTTTTTLTTNMSGRDYRSGQRQLKIQGQTMLAVALIGVVSIILFDQIQENWFTLLDQLPQAVIMV
jgi:protoporphyrin/coproporphyrin ferrochelatase